MFLTRNWLVMNGILFGTTIDESRILFLCLSKARNIPIQLDQAPCCGDNCVYCINVLAAFQTT